MDATSTTLQSGIQVPVLSLESLLNDDTSRGVGADLWPLLKAHGYLRPRSVEEIGVLLDSAGDSRFLGKSASFLALLQEEEPDQLLYSDLMEALGYSQNREPFLELAGSVPYRRLAKAVLRSAANERHSGLQRILLAAAGFAPGGAKAMSRNRWHTFRVRPNNHPKWRILGFAHVLELFLPSSQEAPISWARVGLVRGMAELARVSEGPVHERGRWLPLERALMGVPGARSGGPTVAAGGEETGSPIGRGRARDMVVNCVLPYLHAMAGLQGDVRLACLSTKLYHEFPRLQENELTREMRRQLFPAMHRAKYVDEGTFEMSPGVGGASKSTPDANAGVRGGKDDGVEGNWEGPALNARRQQGLLHLHQLVTSPFSNRAAGQLNGSPIVDIAAFPVGTLAHREGGS